MINLFSTEIDNLYIHRVGNKCRKEELFLSQDIYNISDEIRPILKEFFLKPFREKETQYFGFSENSELKSIIHDYLFELDTTYSSFSAEIARHLYDQGNHPHIKAGEVYICQLSNMIIDNYKCEGIGIFKSEIKQDFLEFHKSHDNLDFIIKQGVNLAKLDKGAIIFEDPERKTGSRIIYIDSNKYDSKYWMENCLELVEIEDSIFQTRNYLKFCQDFAKDVVKPAEGHQAEMEFVNDTYNYFASRDEFREQNFKEEVVNKTALLGEFEHYKIIVDHKYSIEDLTEFPISNETVNDCMKKIRGEITLDTGITIKVAKGSQSASKYLEKGWDEERQMYYYLSYFNKEEK